MSEIKKTRKEIRQEAKLSIAADKRLERDARENRKAENKGKPLC